MPPMRPGHLATVAEHGALRPQWVGTELTLQPHVVRILTMSTMLAASLAWFRSKPDRGGPDSDDGSAGSDPLVPPTEQILSLLEAHDGRMYQSDLVDRLEKSPSSVSRYLAELEAADQVVRIRLGRTNLVTTPDGIPSAASDDARQVPPSAGRPE